MSDVTLKRIEEVPAYAGEHAIPGIRFRPAARALGVTSWGMNVIEIEPGCDRYPEHDHAAGNHEEVYLVLRGSATLSAGGRTWDLAPGQLVRVAPEVKRKMLPGPEGVTFLALGGTPGVAYDPESR